MPELQEMLALGIVALVAGLYWYRRRRRPPGSCGDCASAGPPAAAESTIRFYRRNPAPEGRDGAKGSQEEKSA